MCVCMCCGFWPGCCDDDTAMASLYWTPKLVQALLLAAGHTGRAAVAAAAAGSSSGSGSGSSKFYNTSSSNSSSATIGRGLESGTAGGGAGPGVSCGAAQCHPLRSSLPVSLGKRLALSEALRTKTAHHSDLAVGCRGLLLLPFAASGGLAAAEPGADSSGSSTSAAGATISAAASVAAFVLLTVAHVGVNGAKWTADWPQ